MMHEIKIVIRAKLQARGCILSFIQVQKFVFHSLYLIVNFYWITGKPKFRHGATGSRFADKQREEDTFTGAWCFCLPRPTLELHIPVIMM